MSVKTGRADGPAVVTIDESVCTGCGNCAEVCKGAPLMMQNGRVVQVAASYMGCVGCGQCMAVCPKHCITVEGRDMHPGDAIDLPPVESRTAYDPLYGLMLARRSVRNYKDRLVEQEKIEKILLAASTAPMGIPPTDVGVLVLDGKENVRQLANDLLTMVEKFSPYITPFTLALSRPFMGKESYEATKSFILPIMKVFVEKHKEGIDWMLYDAPLMMYFYTSLYSDPVDPVIPATYAMLAAESLGLGTCMIGTVGYFFQYSKNLKRKYGLPLRHKPGVAVIMGYPVTRYHRALRRRFAGVQQFPN